MSAGSIGIFVSVQFSFFKMSGVETKFFFVLIGTHFQDTKGIKDILLIGGMISHTYAKKHYTIK